MIGHHVKKALETKARRRLTKLAEITNIHQNIEDYSNWEPKQDGRWYHSPRAIPLEHCEICGIAPLENQAQYHTSRRIYRHHIFPRSGNEPKEKEWGYIRPIFCMTCGSCHIKIHKELGDIKIRTKEMCYEAIRNVKNRWINRKKDAERW